MKRQAISIAAVAVILGAAVYSTRTPTVTADEDAVRYTASGELVRPEGYRRWVYLSSGFGMSYSPDAGGNGNPAFTNVFVNPASYESFVASGKWPDKTMFVLEVYSSTSHGSINQHGSFQKEFRGLDIEVKDQAKFKDQWAYFGFDETQKSSAAMTPAKNECWTCHEQSAAVEHSFVQFYPELLKIARTKGTIKKTVKLD